MVGLTRLYGTRRVLVLPLRSEPTTPLFHTEIADEPAFVFI